MGHRFYVNQPLAAGPLLLHGPEAHHLASVCRIRAGQQVVLFNGDGWEWTARVEQIGKKAVLLEVLEGQPVDRELGFAVVVACPLPKGDRGQFLIEKLTELGVTTYVPLITQRSSFAVTEARVDKLQRYVIEACKQCGRNRLMEIRPPLRWSQLVAETSWPARRWLGEAGGQPAALGPARDTLAVVGPEGGLTPEEVASARAAGWQAISLGPRTFRIETAALVLAALSIYGSLPSYASAPAFPAESPPATPLGRSSSGGKVL
jgi:16S rRNA (uracil1498-N3)-methyltransferase